MLYHLNWLTVFLQSPASQRTQTSRQRSRRRSQWVEQDFINTGYSAGAFRGPGGSGGPGHQARGPGLRRGAAGPWVGGPGPRPPLDQGLGPRHALDQGKRVVELQQGPGHTLVDLQGVLATQAGEYVKFIFYFNITYCSSAHTENIQTEIKAKPSFHWFLRFFVITSN